MSFALALTPPTVLILLLVFLPAFFKLFRQCHLQDVTPEFLENFSPVVYRPMEFLLAEDDFEYLNSQPGFDTSLVRKLRRDRIRIFRQYLNRLIRDFNRLHVCARYMLAKAEGDHSALVGRLVWLRLRFAVTVLRVEASLVFSYFGFPPRVVGQVIARLDEMNSYLQTLSAA